MARKGSFLRIEDETEWELSEDVEIGVNERDMREPFEGKEATVSKPGRGRLGSASDVIFSGWREDMIVVVGEQIDIIPKGEWTWVCRG